jgi:small subunit ribosomal protein S10e
MIVSKEHRLEIYNYLYKEGVLVARKNFQAPRHPNIPGVTNLEVIQLMKGFTSKGLVRENFAWRHYYWYLTNEGINYLREYLSIPSNYVPATLKAEKKEAKPIQRSTVGPRREPRFSDRSQYRAEEKRIPQGEQPQEEQPGAERGAGATRGRGFSRGRGGARGGARFSAPRQE